MSELRIMLMLIKIPISVTLREIGAYFHLKALEGLQSECVQAEGRVPGQDAIRVVPPHPVSQQADVLRTRDKGSEARDLSCSIK